MDIVSNKVEITAKRCSSPNHYEQLSNINMIQWIKKILGLARSEQITKEQIEQLSAAKLCRKFINGELARDVECKAFDSIMCAVELHAEVINGGFNQYYYNSDGERAERARETFIKLGAMEVADLVRRAHEQFASCRNELHSEWDGTMQGFAYGYNEKVFDLFDDEYYILMKNDKQLYTLIGTYIKQNPQEFLTKETK